MKRILFVSLSIIIALSSAGFAANPGSAAAAAGDSGKLGVGFWATTPTLRYNFSDHSSGQLGFQYASGGGTNGTNILFGGDVDVMKISGHEVNMGCDFYLTSAAGVSTFSASLTTGVDVKIAPSIVLELKVYPISLWTASGGGSTSLGILDFTTVGAHIYL